MTRILNRRPAFIDVHHAHIRHFPQRAQKKKAQKKKEKKKAYNRSTLAQVNVLSMKKIRYFPKLLFGRFKCAARPTGDRMLDLGIPVPEHEDCLFATPHQRRVADPLDCLLFKHVTEEPLALVSRTSSVFQSFKENPQLPTQISIVSRMHRSAKDETSSHTLRL